MPRPSLKSKMQRLSRKLPRSRKDGLDKFRDFYFNGDRLLPEEEKTLSNMRRAHSIFCLYASKNQTIKILIDELKISESHCYNILRDAIKLFGDVNETDKKGMRLAKYEYYMMLSNMARQEKDFSSAIKASELADKISGLFDEDSAKIPSKILFPPTHFIFVSDANILKEQAKEEAETDYTLLDE